MTQRQERYLKFKKFNWPKVIELAERSNIRLVSFCTVDVEESDPQRKNRTTMSPAFLIALVILRIDLRDTVFGTLETLFTTNNPYMTKKLIEHHKALMWEAYLTMPQSIKDEQTSFEIRQKFRSDRLAQIQPRLAVSQTVEDISINGEEYLRNKQGDIITFATEEQAKVHLRVLGYTRTELEEALETKTIKIGALL
jgi:hypothetical protein